MTTNNTWTLDNIPDQHERTILVTGANTGLGFESSLRLAGKGAHVILAVRDLSRGEAAAEQIRKQYPDASLCVGKLDLADLSSVRRFADEILQRETRLDVLLNNAGVMLPPYSFTTDGFELQIGINHLGHFALTSALLDLLLSTDASRVVNVSSGAHKMGHIDLEDLHWKRRRWNAMRAYADSKLANLYFTFELGRRLIAMQSNSIAVAAHPGVTMTELQRHSTMLRYSSRLIAHDLQTATLPLLRAAVDPNAGNCDFFGPGRFFGMRGMPKRVKPVRRAFDHGMAVKLWTLSEELTGVHMLHNTPARNTA